MEGRDLYNYLFQRVNQSEGEEVTMLARERCRGMESRVKVFREEVPYGEIIKKPQ